MILHLSSRNIIKKIIFNIMVTDSYHLPCSFFSLQGLEHIDLSHCTFEPPLMNKGFSMLKRLHFCECYVTSKMLLGFLTNCPLLEEFTWSGDYGMDIELTESELLELFKCLPSVQVFEISMLHIKHLAAGSMPHKLSISLPHLRILDLHMCYLELSSVLCVIRISPKLEKMKLEMCWDHDQSLEQTFNNLHELQDYTSLNLDHFKEVEITRFRDPCGSWMEFVKVVMGRSPMLKRATIELCKSVSIDKEVEMYQDLVCLPFLRASPTAKFIIKRPKNYCR